MWTIFNLCVLYIERNLTRKIKNIRPMKSLPDWSVQDLWYQISCRSVVLQNPSRWFLHTYKYIGNTVIRYSFTDKLLLKYHESRSFGSVCNICLGCSITPTYTKCSRTLRKDLKFICQSSIQIIPYRAKFSSGEIMRRAKFSSLFKKIVTFARQIFAR